VNDYILKKDAMTLLFAASTATAVIGFGLSLAFIPVPKAKEQCTLYTARKQTETAFVLTPPALACPPVEKCEPSALKQEPSVNIDEPSTVDDQTSTKETVDEPEKPRHKRFRRHRIRKHWRR